MTSKADHEATLVSTVAGMRQVLNQHAQMRTVRELRDRLYSDVLNGELMDKLDAARAAQSMHDVVRLKQLLMTNALFLAMLDRLAETQDAQETPGVN